MPFKDTSASAPPFQNLQALPARAQGRQKPFAILPTHPQRQGSTLQHARSVYSHGPVQILPASTSATRAQRTRSPHRLRPRHHHHPQRRKGDHPGFQRRRHPRTTRPVVAPARTQGHSRKRRTFLRSLPSRLAAILSSASHSRAYFTPPTTASLPGARDNNDAPSPRTAITPRCSATLVHAQPAHSVPP